ncbi:gamma-mobile-trio protein GmtX [Pseudomonas alloputida]|uniref:gamma-mobile-trio protein GmtX n=1 Tax=Pseudomonas TaxID=286 RepID=UPI000EADB179|nr:MULTISPECIES: gamma-mobile-trio protein GmtX [Pseudomonas]BBV98449.1 hypothetical protein STW0522PSE72_38000 [Pseudomonas monteilii]
MTPEELLAVLCERKPKQRASLEAIYAVCQEILEAKSTDFSYANVARLGKSRKVPKAQSIANSTGENYQALIKCFASADSSRKKPKRPRRGDAWADEIKDPQVRLLVQHTLAELTEAQNALKEIHPPGRTIRIDDRSGSAPDFKLNSLERRALEYLRSKDFLNDFKLQEGDLGDVLDQKGRAVFKPGTLDALEKVLKLL